MKSSPRSRSPSDAKALGAGVDQGLLQTRGTVGIWLWPPLFSAVAAGRAVGHAGFLGQSFLIDHGCLGPVRSGRLGRGFAQLASTGAAEVGEKLDRRGFPA